MHYRHVTMGGGGASEPRPCHSCQLTVAKLVDPRKICTLHACLFVHEMVYMCVCVRACVCVCVCNVYIYFDNTK